MLRNKALAAAVLITACGLAIMWRSSTSAGRPGPLARVEASSAGGVARARLGDEEPVVPGDDTDPNGAEDRAKLDVTAPVTTSTEVGAFEADAVYGRVLDPDGAGVAAASVLLFSGFRPLELQAGPRAEAVTDENGRYRFRELDPFETFQVYVEAEGFLPRIGRNSPGHDEETELAGAVSVEGRVLDGQTGQPLAGVEVRNDTRHWSADGYQEFVSTRSDEEGVYRLPWARLEGMQRVFARLPGHSFVQREFQVDERRTDGYDLRLEGGRSVLLEVYDLDSGLVLANTEFELGRGHVAETDGTGRIDLIQVLHAKANDRRVNLSIGGPEWCRTSVNFSLQKEGAPQLIRVPVTRGGTIRGRVVTSAGEPVPDALIRFGNKRDRFGNRAEKRGDLPDNVWIGHRDEPVTSGADGRFEIVAVFPSQQPLRVIASHPHHAGTKDEDLRVTSVEQVVEVELTLGEGGVVQGVVSVDGLPKSTMVTWNSDDGNGWTRSNDRGEYRFRGVTPGKVDLHATLDDKSWSNQQSDPETVWVEEAQVLLHDLVITSNRAAISGVVRESTGKLVENAEVIAWAGEDDFHFSTSTNTDAEGAFELLVEAVPGVMYQLYAREGARHQLANDVTPGATGIELTLPELGELRLAVQDALSGEPIEGFSVYWRLQQEGNYQRLQQGSHSFSPGPDGSFVAELAVGTIDLRISARELGYASVHIPDVRVGPSASDRPLPVRLERGVQVEVVFDYEPGTQKTMLNAIRRRRIAIASEEQRALQDDGGEYFNREVRYGQVLRPDDSGVARVKGIAPGRYGMLHTPKGLVFEPETFEVPLVDQHRVEIRVKPAETEAPAADDP